MVALSDELVKNRIIAYGACYLDAASKSVDARTYGDAGCGKEWCRMLYLMWAQDVMRQYLDGCVTADYACSVIRKADPLCTLCKCSGSSINPVTPVPPCDIQATMVVTSVVDASYEPFAVSGHLYYIVTNTDGWTGAWASHIGYVVVGNGSFIAMADGNIIYDQSSTLFWTSTPTSVPGMYFPRLQWAMIGTTSLNLWSPYPSVHGYQGRDIMVEGMIGGTWTTLYGMATEDPYVTMQSYPVTDEVTEIRVTYKIGNCTYGPYGSASPTHHSHDVGQSHSHAHG